MLFVEQLNSHLDDFVVVISINNMDIFYKKFYTKQMHK